MHRDVSPQNVLISYEGDVKLVDYEGKMPTELFNLANDPDELDNRAGDSAYADVQKRLETATADAHREILQRALTALDEEIATLS